MTTRESVTLPNPITAYAASFRAMVGAGAKNVGLIFFSVYAGTVLQWIAGIANMALTTGVWDFGTTSQIVARLVLSLVTTLATFVGVWGYLWKELEGQHILVKVVFAISSGLAADATWTTATAVNMSLRVLN